MKSHNFAFCISSRNILLLVEKSRVDSHGRETVQMFGLSIPVYSAKQSQNSHEGSAQEGVAAVRNSLLSPDIKSFETKEMF